MASWLRTRVPRAAAGRFVCPLFAAAGLVVLAGCGPDDQPNLNAAAPRGATVAFESIDGLPPEQFKKLVANLNEEAQTRRLAVTSRDSPSAYRVRGYFAAKMGKGQTTVSWVWDVFDRNDHRALRITGSDSARGGQHRAWTAADDAMLHKIASSSMDQLAAFLTSPDIAPSAPAPAQVAAIGGSDASPEAEGIFRIFKPQADPVAETAGAALSESDAVPLPRPRPSTASAVSARGALTVAAVRR